MLLSSFFSRPSQQHAAEAAQAGIVIAPSSSSVTPSSSTTDKRSTDEDLALAETQRLVANIQRTNVFGCPVCRRAFSQRSEMERHLTTHSSPKPHLCGICGKGFARKDNLKEHRLSVHPTAVDDDAATGANEELIERPSPSSSGAVLDDAPGAVIEAPPSPAALMSLTAAQPLTSMRPVAS